MSVKQEGRIFTNDNCTGCNRCISACTVPDANIAVLEDGQNKIHVDADQCINCAKCIEACPHDARDYLDDTEQFLQDIGKGEDIAVLIAPAFRSNFPQHGNLLGALRKLGVNTIYDTSFGADICTWGYVRYMQKNNTAGLISQPCPAVVNYIEKHAASLIPTLAPVHSPAMCAAIYMKKHAGVKGKIAFLSPCIAKKDEFSDPNTGNLVQYNVTFRKLHQALTAKGVDYRKAPVDRFDNDQHGLGAIYPMPGGLKQNVHRIAPDAWVHQVEGQPEVKHFLDDYGQQIKSRNGLPFLVDILNCQKGCNLGTGAICGGKDALGVDKAMYDAANEVKAEQQKRGLFHREAKKLDKGKTLEEFDKALKLEDFIRRYSGKQVKPVPVSPQQLERAYLELHKETTAARRINCCSCGFGTCEEMATAIAKGINHVENCVEYHKSVLQIQQERMEEIVQNQEHSSEELRTHVENIFEALSTNAGRSGDTTERVTRIADEVTTMKEIAARLSAMMDSLSEQLRQYETMGGQIVSISTMTKLLSMNASVEAAHARDVGKGFAVVADQMKSLSDQSASSAKEILASNEKVFPMLDEVRLISETLNERAGVISGSAAEILKAMRSINDAEQAITETASKILNDNR